ncbi:hypothetical protein ALC56_13704 [Trachymyrmex septentrionalis]|uniref:Uncharacterized protein n=1 Tax=Trachymyrmex septentrionalis TaxID=34720 RepID=A0A195EUX2_9HYME|nr:hypothetical protein ALC56_13704 [Trachymyrmex septentrionalis]
MTARVNKSQPNAIPGIDRQLFSCVLASARIVDDILPCRQDRECSRSNRHDPASKYRTNTEISLVFGVGIYSVEKPQNPGESCSAGWKQATEPMNRFFQRRPEGQPSFSSTRIAEKKHVEPDSMRESAAQAVQRIHVGTHEIEVDGLSVYRCSLWDASNVRNDGKPTFLQPRMPLRSLRASDKNQN